MFAYIASVTAAPRDWTITEQSSADRSYDIIAGLTYHFGTLGLIPPYPIPPLLPIRGGSQ